MKGHLKVVLKMFRPVIYYILFFIVQLNSCKGIVSSGLQDNNSTDIVNLLNENYSGFEEEEYFLIKNQEALNLFYGKINRTRKPGLTPPEIDFTQNMLLVWCGDSKISSFADLEIKESDENLIIHKLKSRTEKENNLIVSPFSVYKLPLSSKALKIQ
ncbi:hypothetical protein [uncultured Maribacter sp.]|uniref:hypothetical protein n=1 Tax=uncultured Maribacter sp. TaxID=431308 RepID=UPI0030EE2F4B|tara:strand:+ start:15158 stop:15628 length:471 start_codon:yes stop_codon:yes gene_type:complete